MAINIDQIKYLPDLPAAGAVSLTDLLHVSQAGSDRQLTIDALMRFMDNRAHPVGQIMIFGTAANPNTLFPGQTWVRTLVDESFRGCNSTGSNLNTTLGADAVTLIANNIPAHTHPVNLTTSTAGNHTHNAFSDPNGNHQHYFTTSTNGNHNHNFPLTDDRSSSGRADGGNTRGYDGLQYTSDAGNHSHDGYTNWQGEHTHAIGVQAAGNHQHTLTGNTGNNTTTTAAFNNVPLTRRVAAWIRTA